MFRTSKATFAPVLHRFCFRLLLLLLELPLLRLVRGNDVAPPPPPRLLLRLPLRRFRLATRLPSPLLVLLVLGDDVAPPLPPPPPRLLLRFPLRTFRLAMRPPPLLLLLLLELELVALVLRIVNIIVSWREIVKLNQTLTAITVGQLLILHFYSLCTN